MDEPGCTHTDHYGLNGYLPMIWFGVKYIQPYHGRKKMKGTLPP
jgi:hypothetical protein